MPTPSAPPPGRDKPSPRERPRSNRLAREKSPYLLQHADNPVDWHPWSEAAFTRARAEEKPVFLSIGYSTCHWCHVMAHESFEDEEVAALLNRHFVAIKVDREERPDIDATYMAACQMMTGSGGWPLTVILDPERQPFFAGTYFPPRSRPGVLGLIPLLEKIVELWQGQRQRVLATGTQLAVSLRQRNSRSAPDKQPGGQPLRQALQLYRQTFDATHAGFGAAPKFPAPHNLSLLLRLGARFASEDAEEMAVATLLALRRGGIYDQLGFGLHRYAVDARWLVPHFEKMLYDQALLILAANEAWQVRRDPALAQIAIETAAYLLRDLQHREGGFYCGEDADSEGEEGAFYLWTPAQVHAVLGDDRAELFCRHFDISAAGNFEGRSIPNLLGRHSPPDPVTAEQLEQARIALLAARTRRLRPHLDRKLLTGWNGLAIAALAKAGAALGRPDLVAAARAAADFVRGHLRTATGRLLRRWCDGEAAIPAFLEDYAFFCWGLLELHQAQLLAEDLQLALELATAMEDLFGDGEGGLFDIGRDAEEVLGRGRSLQDGAIPSGTSVAIGVLLRLGRVSGQRELTARGLKLLALSLPEIERYPAAYAQALCALDVALAPEAELSFWPGAEETAPSPLLAAVQQGFYPGLVWRRGSGPAPEPGPTAQLCRDHTCLAPVHSAAKLLELLAPAARP
ncbi:thioredoxin domain-containing protein [Desulfuromonas carbonis]|uniref:thioredoxin domain-containing protein n=1 Tax=Desulfuromonas sp. DDH964 TaxID=1823759 RepID=UPI00078D8183|nr:thioredoxin domain-containing protein [Desulfuromonas sp. DDH964]AMV72747.1 thioredoxin domain-containing protein YyaL [Desulfuromonas sp. DDH964]